MLGLGFLQLVLPRRYAFVPVMIAGCYMTLGQALVVWELHFYLIRVLILFGVVRIVFRKELFDIIPNGIDGVLMAWLSVGTFLYVLFDGTNATLTGRLGSAYDAVGLYVLVRASVRSVDDVLAVVKACAVVIIPLGVLFIMEKASGRNPFAALGGVPSLSEIRNGRVRCQGPFLHPILAGTFGATAMPALVGLWIYGKGTRLLSTLAITSAAIIVITAGSSGGVSALVVGTASLMMWPFRKKMRVIRWGMLIALLGLAVVMKQPIWFLIARVSDLTGGGGWYRSELIDAAIRHFDEWWLIGTGYTAHWMPTGAIVDSSSADLVNEFVFQGVKGGLLMVLLFIWLLVKCFKTVGTAVCTPADYPLQTRFAIWSIGCGLVGHFASFFSISYFDQIIIFWYLLLGMIAAIARHTDALVSSPSLAKTPGAARQTRLGHFHAGRSDHHGLARLARSSAGGRDLQEI